MKPENLNANVDTVASLVARAEQGVSPQQRRVEILASHLGRPRALHLIVVFASLWVAANVLTMTLGARPVDPPPFAWLQGLTGLVALLMTTTILTTQNRQSRHAEQRAQLDLQVNLLAEQKIAKLIALIEELRRDIPIVRDRVDHVAEVMKEPVDAHAVLSALEHTLEAEAEPPRGPPNREGPPR